MATVNELLSQKYNGFYGSFSRVCLMECDSNGHIPQKLIVKYHNTETLFYEYARNVDGVLRTFLNRPLTADDNKGIICMEHLEGAHTRPVYENISIEEMKSFLKLYANIQKGCAKIPDNVCAQLNTNVFELLSTTTLSLEILKLYVNIQKGCARIPDDVCTQLNTNVFELLSTTTLSLEMLTQRLTRMALWAPEMTSTLQQLVQFLSQIVNHTTVTCLHSECPFRHLLVHGDLYSSNILWQNGIVKAVIDYQMVHYGNPVEDLIRLFTTGLTVSERKAHTIELLDYYRRQITSLIPDLEGSLTVDWLWSCYKKIFPMAGLWAMVSLHASYESATSQTPPDSIKLKTVVEKIHGIAAEILEMFS
ncbi:hypothetical protein TELCIR_14401 [Teladorsagia circumcincta]|uniref:CHK kinase-like domain-containing protein n=1 Tax=Teladorsagia circumcincta TaxID=45464 RepID=A0A2G9U1C0_TELCI|nr:hypothetical protein TELCIR_14401 [Teladorsagia circumcincta]